MQNSEKAKRLPLTPQQRQQIIQWFAKPEGQLFRRVLESQRLWHQLEAGVCLSINPFDEDRKAKATHEAANVYKYGLTLATVDAILSEETDPETVGLVVVNPV